MDKLLKNKLEAAIDLRNFTNEIKDLSPKTDYSKVNSMLGEREKLIESINTINSRIKDAIKDKNFVETKEMKVLNKKTKQVFTEISEIDTIIRKNINSELKIVKDKLNRPEESSKMVNIKA